LVNEIQAGDPILLTYLQGNDKNSLAYKIPVGKRFFTLNIKDKMISNGWISPNDHIDILATINLPDRGETTFTILQDITLVTVGKNSSWQKQKANGGSEIGFFVTPKQFEVLSFAGRKGTFSVSLRNPEDTNLAQSKVGFGDQGVDMGNFLDSQIIRKASGGGNLKVTIGKKD